MAIKLIYQHFTKSEYEFHSDFRKAIETHLKLILKGRTVLNHNTGFTIQFNKIGIEKIVSSIGDIKAMALCNLQPILRHGLFVEAKPDHLLPAVFHMLEENGFLPEKNESKQIKGNEFECSNGHKFTQQ